MDINATIIAGAYATDVKQEITVIYDPDQHITSISISADTVTLGVASTILFKQYLDNLSTVPVVEKILIRKVIEEAIQQWIK